jgi:hypothetical protein
VNEPNPGDPSLSAPFEVERVEWIPSSGEVLEVRVTGRWRDGLPGAAASLLVDDEGRTRPFAAQSSEGEDSGRWTARFLVPVELRGALRSHVTLLVDEREVPLPAASPGPTDETDAPPPATVVDPGVLEGLRARRDSHVDEAMIRRAQAAEATAVTLETQLGHLEDRLRQTLAERDALTARLRAAEQAEEAERRVRGEAEEEREQAETELSLLRGRVAAAEQHAAALAVEMDAIRREGAEAQHAALTARVAADRAIALAGGGGAQAELDRLRREATLMTSQLDAQRSAREEAEVALARQADRVAEVEATVTLLETELERRASIQTAVQGELESLRAALADVRARAEDEATRETSTRRALDELNAAAAALRERVTAVEEAERTARAQVRETQAELAARDGDLGRLRVELERSRTELATAQVRQDGAAAALREAERTVVAIRHEAAELQSRLEEERRRRFEAEAALKVELARERERFGEAVAEVEAELRARIAAERSAFETQAASIEALVSGLRERLASAGAELEARLSTHRLERDEAVAARDAAVADAERTKLGVAEDLQRAAAEREVLLARVSEIEEELVTARPRVEQAVRELAEAEATGRAAVVAALAEGEAALAAARTDHGVELSTVRAEGEAALAAAQAEAERRVLQVGAELANRMVEVELERDTLLATLAAREEELVVLRALTVDGEARTATIEELVADVVRMTAELREGYDRQLAELTPRVETELGGLRTQLEEERTARWVAEQELAAERERGTQPGTFVAASLHRTELEATRRELAAAQEALAAERLRTGPPTGETSQLLRDLEAAGTRLKDNTPATAAPGSWPEGWLGATEGVTEPPAAGAPASPAEPAGPVDPVDPAASVAEAAASLVDATAPPARATTPPTDPPSEHDAGRAGDATRPATDPTAPLGDAAPPSAEAAASPVDAAAPTEEAAEPLGGADGPLLAQAAALPVDAAGLPADAAGALGDAAIPPAAAAEPLADAAALSADAAESSAGPAARPADAAKSLAAAAAADADASAGPAAPVVADEADPDAAQATDLDASRAQASDVDVDAALAAPVPSDSRAALDAALAALVASAPPAPPPADAVADAAEADAGSGLPAHAADAVSAAFAAADAGEAGSSADDPDSGRPALPTPPGATLLSLRVVRGSERPLVGWLAPAIAKLAAQDEVLAAELIVELLPAQAGIVRDPLAYGVTIDGHGSYRVAVNAERALVEPRAGEYWPQDVEASISGTPAALAPLVAGTARRKLGGTKVAGRKRRMRRILRGRRAPLDLSDLAERGIRPAPEPLLGVLAAGVDPSWTAGHSFAVAYALSGGETVEVEVRDGQPLRIQTGMHPTSEPPAATIALRDLALLPLLSHTHLPPGERVFVTGDRHAVALLHSWFDRAQGLPAA